MAKGDISVREAGKRGGKATSRTHGKEFYSKIGKKGGKIGGPRSHMHDPGRSPKDYGM